MCFGNKIFGFSFLRNALISKKFPFQKIIYLKAVLIIFLMSACLPARAMSFDWTTPGPNNQWNNSANWTPTGVPG